MSGATLDQRWVGDAQLKEVARYAAEVVGCVEAVVDRIERFAQGNRHAVYRVSFVDDVGEVVVRLSLTDEPSERDHATREAEVLAAVGPPVAPELLDVRITSERFAAPVVCTRYVPGDDTPIGPAPNHSLTALGAVVAQLHATDLARLPTWRIPEGGVEGYARQRLDRAMDRYANTPSALPEPLQRRLDVAAFRAERRALADISPDLFRTPLRLLHADLGPGNVVWGAAPVLIDWEYARIGDPADEIAYAFDQNGLDASQRDAFLGGYRADDGIADRIGWWEPVTLLGSLLWRVDWWLRRTRADASGIPDPSAQRDADYSRRRTPRPAGAAPRRTTMREEPRPSHRADIARPVPFGLVWPRSTIPLDQPVSVAAVRRWTVHRASQAENAGSIPVARSHTNASPGSTTSRRPSQGPDQHERD